jgi:general secretion pathway protein G
MHAISASCQPSPEGRRQAGFTLLELLVVLALVGLAVGLVAPAAQRGIEAARERSWGQDLVAALAALPVRAYGAGQALEVDATALRAKLPGLPANWQLAVAPPLRYSANGMATGGRVKLQAPGQPALEWDVQPLTGEPLPRAGGSR